MLEKEAKQYLRSQIESCIETEDEINKYVFMLYYNKSYVRALKLSTITGNSVNKNDFEGGVKLFYYNVKLELFSVNERIGAHLHEKYSINEDDIYKIIEDVFNEYNKNKNYTIVTEYKY